MPKQTKIVEFGTAVLDALPDLGQADQVIILDAMKDDQAPGTIYKTYFEHCSGASCIVNARF